MHPPTSIKGRTDQMHPEAGNSILHTKKSDAAKQLKTVSQSLTLDLDLSVQVRKAVKSQYSYEFKTV